MKDRVKYYRLNAWKGTFKVIRTIKQLITHINLLQHVYTHQRIFIHTRTYAYKLGMGVSVNLLNRNLVTLSARAPEAIWQVWRSSYQSWTLMGGAIPIISVKIFKMLRILISKCNNFRYFAGIVPRRLNFFETQINVMRNCVKRNKYGRKSRTNLLLLLCAYVPPPML